MLKHIKSFVFLKSIDLNLSKRYFTNDFIKSFVPTEQQINQFHRDGFLIGLLSILIIDKIFS